MDLETLQPKKINNRFYQAAGFVILFLNKIRHELQGYRRPRPFPVTKIAKAVEYDLQVIEKYLAHADVAGKKVLELGPGADLGVGLGLLAKGAKEYIALDVNHLADKAPRELYSEMAKRVGGEKLLQQVDLALQNNPDKLSYIVDKNFDIEKFNDIDVVFSHAAFEHFDDVEQVIMQIAKVLKPGGKLVSEVDLQTHTRWIREEDPLNIYRYSDSAWRRFKFLGSPNRVRPERYKALLEKHGFKNVQILPVITLDQQYVAKVRPTLNNEFKNDPDLVVLSFMLLATAQ